MFVPQKVEKIKLYLRGGIDTINCGDELQTASGKFISDLTPLERKG